MTILQRGAFINGNNGVATTQFDEQTLRPNINTFNEQYKENLWWLSDYKLDTLQGQTKLPYLPQQRGLTPSRWTQPETNPVVALQNQHNSLPPRGQ